MNELWVAVDDDGWCCISVSQEQPKLNKKNWHVFRWRSNVVDGVLVW